MRSPKEQIIDELLVMGAQDGNSRAMEALVSRWQKRLWHHAYHLTNDNQAAWDVTQQSWIGIIKGLRKLNDPAKFKAWAYRITTNKSINWFKKNKTAKHLSIDQLGDYPQKEIKEHGAKELLEKLDVRKKTILILHYFEQLSIPDISIVLNIPKGTVKSRLHSARKELKELWQKHYE